MFCFFLFFPIQKTKWSLQLYRRKHSTYRNHWNLMMKVAKVCQTKENIEEWVNHQVTLIERQLHENIPFGIMLKKQPPLILFIMKRSLFLNTTFAFRSQIYTRDARPCTILIPTWGSIWGSSGFFHNQNNCGLSSACVTCMLSERED